MNNQQIRNEYLHRDSNFFIDKILGFVECIHEYSVILNVYSFFVSAVLSRFADVGRENEC